MSLGLERKKVRLRQRGAVLIFVLWVLSFLAVLAVNLGYGVRQKMIFLKRMDARSQAQHLAAGSIKMAVAILIDELQKSQFQYTASSKAFRHNNPSRFAEMRIVQGTCEISYPVGADLVSKEKRYGVIDEESKINVNTAEKAVLIRLMSGVLSLDDNSAERIAEAIYDWRQLGDSEIKGFLSDDYYSNLQFPYPKKSLPFELIDELLLVKGIDRPKYEVLRHFLTVYGNGQVNINTAPKEVILALGLDEPVADKLLALRRGPDGVDHTADDHIFNRTFDIATEVNAYQELPQEEMRLIDRMNQRGLLTTNSYHYTIQAQAFLSGTNDTRRVEAVFNSIDNRIVYWREK